MLARMSEASITVPEPTGTTPRVSAAAPARSVGAYGRPPVPRTFSHKSWKHYRLSVERYYRSKISGEPTVDQLETIAGIAEALFNAYKQGAEARRSTGRESREAACAADKHRYTFTKLLDKLERSLAAKAPAASKTEPSLNQHLEAMRKGRVGAS